MRMGTIQPPVIQQMAAIAAGRPGTISLFQGVPFFPPPPEALGKISGQMVGGSAAAKSAAHDGLPGQPEQIPGGRSETISIHRYCTDAGEPALREALAEKLRRENGIDADPSDGIMVTHGANQGFFNAAACVAGVGEEVILLRPYYFNHEMALRILGIVPVFVDSAGNGRPDTEALRRAITERTRAIVTISPNNPTGAVYPERALRQINDLCGEHGIYHLSDEPYEYFLFDGARHFSPGALSSDSGDFTISFFSFSKSYGMSGWRIGYMTHPPEMAADLLKVQDTIVICPTVPAQRLALECLGTGKNYPLSFMPRIRESREIVKKALIEMTEEGSLDFIPGQGGYYFYATLNGRKIDSFEAARRLAVEHGVLTVPGGAFGAPGNEAWLRISYGSAAPAAAEEGMGRFGEGVRQIVKTAHEQFISS